MLDANGKLLPIDVRAGLLAADAKAHPFGHPERADPGVIRRDRRGPHIEYGELIHRMRGMGIDVSAALRVEDIYRPADLIILSCDKGRVTVRQCNIRVIERNGCSRDHPDIASALAEYDSL